MNGMKNFNITFTQIQRELNFCPVPNFIPLSLQKHILIPYFFLIICHLRALQTSCTVTPKTLQYVFPKSKDILLHKYCTVTKIRKFDLDICYIIHYLYLKYETVSIISSTAVFFFPGNEICHSEVSFSLLLLRTVVNYLNKF